MNGIDNKNLNIRIHQIYETYLTVISPFIIQLEILDSWNNFWYFRFFTLILDYFRAVSFKFTALFFTKISPKFIDKSRYDCYNKSNPS